MFSEFKIYPGHGINFIQKDGKVSALVLLTEAGRVFGRVGLGGWKALELALCSPDLATHRSSSSSNTLALSPKKFLLIVWSHWC